MSSIDSLLGLSLQEISFEPESTNWIFDFGSKNILRIAAPWRIAKGNSILLGSIDHKQQFGLSVPIDVVLKTKSILQTQIVATEVSPCADLLITFDGGEKLEIFNPSSGYEGWQFFAPDGTHLIAQGGGKLVPWTGN